ncbi:DUS5 phosphatase, partial [Nesospiza acunhae]|nr:DUS5 phosphatase [Nesospiza acunhae]
SAGMKVTSLDCRQLRKLLRKEPSRCLVLDCRPYLSYSASCLRGSLNVNLNSVVMRRARGGAVPLHFVCPKSFKQIHFPRGALSFIDTPLDSLLGAAIPLHCWSFVCPSLELKQSLGGQMFIFSSFCCFLGGYETFNSQYPECCVNGKLISPERTEAERNLASHCEKQSANHKPAYDQGGPVEILPFLYLGSAYHASKCEFLANLHITALLNVSRKSSESFKDQYCYKWIPVEDRNVSRKSSEPFKDQYCYKWIPVEDSHTADISSHFQEAIDFIDQVRRAGGRILVHCEAGISRSPTICMAYLMKTRKLRLDEAFDYIKQRRSLISPNFGFMGQLLQYESEILSSTPSPPVTSCKREAASFFAEELTLGKNFEGSCFAFPTSVLSSVPIHSPVHQLKLSPMTASSSC